MVLRHTNLNSRGTGCIVQGRVLDCAWCCVAQSAAGKGRLLLLFDEGANLYFKFRRVCLLDWDKILRR